jgi:hypothetical protein
LKRKVVIHAFDYMAIQVFSLHNCMQSLCIFSPLKMLNPSNINQITISWSLNKSTSLVTICIITKNYKSLHPTII